MKKLIVAPMLAAFALAACGSADTPAAEQAEVQADALEETADEMGPEAGAPVEAQADMMEQKADAIEGEGMTEATDGTTTTTAADGEGMSTTTTETTDKMAK